MSKKFLLVDDERDFVQTLAERLETRGLEAATAFTGEAAMAIVAADKPAVVVLDQKLPGMDGLEILRRIKLLGYSPEVIMLTGHGSEQNKQRALALGAFAYLHKPVDINKLVQILKEAEMQSAQSQARRSSATNKPHDESDKEPGTQRP